MKQEERKERKEAREKIRKQREEENRKHSEKQRIIIFSIVLFVSLLHTLIFWR